MARRCTPGNGADRCDRRRGRCVVPRRRDPFPSLHPLLVPRVHRTTGAAITFGEQYVAALAEAPGAREEFARPPRSRFTASASPRYPAGWSSHVRRGRARLLFAEYDHHSLVAFLCSTSCGTWRCPTTRPIPPHVARWRPRTAHEPGWRSTCVLASRPNSPCSPLVLDGQWNEALTIAHDLPEPGNAYLRREVRGALSGSADIAASLRSPGSKSMSSFLVDRRPSPATSSIKKDYSSSASQSISAWTRAIFRALMLG